MAGLISVTDDDCDDVFPAQDVIEPAGEEKSAGIPRTEIDRVRLRDRVEQGCAEAGEEVGVLGLDMAFAFISQFYSMAERV